MALAHSEHRRGLGYALAAYVLWGLLPIYFVILDPATPLEVLAWRILFSLALCVAILLVTSNLRPALALLRSRRNFTLSLAAGVFIFFNWGVFVYAAQNGAIVDAALGYFINPLLSAALGVVVLRERLRPLQWAALAMGVVAVAVLVIGLGYLPWISLVLALSFGLYGLVKRVMGSTGAVEGLTLETLWLSPVAVGLVVWLSLRGELTIWSEGVGHALTMGLIGVATTVPLLFFAGAAKRLPLVTLGLVQYVNPIMQALVGILIMGEAMPAVRWVGFGLVWVALVLFALDALRQRN